MITEKIMANNRMFLLHHPSQIGIMLGKHMGRGWYKAPNKQQLEGFYGYIDKYNNVEDLILITEDSNDWVFKNHINKSFINFEKVIK